MAADMEKVEMILMETEDKMTKSVSVLRSEYLMIRVGRANPHVLDKVLVDFYGQPTPINQVGNISVQDGKCLVIAPWDKSLLKNVEKAILGSGVGITPTNDGNVIRLVFPDLTEERRIEISKQVKKMKTAKEITEDEYTEFEKEVNDYTNKAIENVEKAQQEKEKEVMTV